MNIIQARFIIVYSLFFIFCFFFKQKLKLFSGSLKALWVCVPDKVIGPERKALPLRKHPSTSQGTPWPPSLASRPAAQPREDSLGTAHLPGSQSRLGSYLLPMRHPFCSKSQADGASADCISVLFDVQTPWLGSRSPRVAL